MNPICVVCDEQILPTEGIRYRVTGWEKERTAGGTNALELRERTGDVAHAHCIDRAKRVHPQQQELFA